MVQNLGFVPGCNLHSFRVGIDSYFNLLTGYECQLAARDEELKSFGYSIIGKVSVAGQRRSINNAARTGHIRVKGIETQNGQGSVQPRPMLWSWPPIREVLVIINDRIKQISD